MLYRRRLESKRRSATAKNNRCEESAYYGHGHRCLMGKKASTAGPESNPVPGQCGTWERLPGFSTEVCQHALEDTVGNASRWLTGGDPTRLDRAPCLDVWAWDLETSRWDALVRPPAA